MTSIKRVTILKILKESGKYERRFFTMKKDGLIKECEKLGIDISQDLSENKPKKVQIKKKIELLEPLSSSSDDESDDEEEIPKTPVIKPAEAPKKQKQKLNRRAIKEKEKEKVEERVPKQNSMKQVNKILKDLNYVIKELFSEFDKKDLDDEDISYIQNEFNLTVNDAQDLLDELIKDFSDSDIEKIESRIDLLYRKLDRFIS
jgi:hypothetical protein